jgi:bifunctional UDP-N-acetylglucosamine pyrophosphorylase / glucosamine-1-phosphate N-acetyltransferase
MIQHVLEAAKQCGSQEIRLVLGHGETLVRPLVEPMGAVCFKQQQQKGTADAVRAAEPDSIEGVVLILNGDHPLIEVEDLKKILSDFHNSSAVLGVVTVEMKTPGAYGRIVRHQGRVRAIVEAKDASHETLKIREVNTGIYVVRAETLKKYLPLIESKNAQNEFYLTDLVTLVVEDGGDVQALKSSLHVAQGVNDQIELARATRILFKRKVLQLMRDGVVVLDPKTTYIEADVQIGAGTVLYPNVYLRGKTKIGSMAVVESGVMISSSQLGDGVVIKAGCYLDQAQVGPLSSVGPYAHLRPGTELGQECKVGNFVEMKKVQFGDRSKASHLTYLGDAEVGTDTNIGCGTITCNYAVDHKKYKTKIGNHVFVGSDTQLVAPIQVGDYAVIGSGSTITKDVPERALAVARGKQFIKENYVSKVEEKTEDKES